MSSTIATELSPVVAGRTIPLLSQELVLERLIEHHGAWAAEDGLSDREDHSRLLGKGAGRIGLRLTQ